MIINGGSRSNGAFFARHLMRADENERVDVVEMRGLGAETVSDAFREMQAMARGTACKNFFYHANINTRADERLSPEQWAQAVDTLERELHLEGQPRFVVEHQKEGRTHCHVVWSRIDRDSFTTISDSLTYPKHERAARECEEAFGHEAVPSVLVKDRETPRPERNPQDWESFRAADTGIDPKAMRAELTELWQHSDSGPAFAAALEERGYILARGDRRDFCVIDSAGDEHSLARRIAGVKAADVRARMADVDREVLPSVEEARAMARQRPEEPTGDSSAPAEAVSEQAAPMQTAPELTPFEVAMQETVRRARLSFPRSVAEELQAHYAPAATAAIDEGEERSTFDVIMAERVQEARASAAREAANPDSGWERFSAWLGTMREHVAGLSQEARDYWNQHFRNYGEAEAAPDDPAAPMHGTPGTTVTGPGLITERVQERGQGMEPDL